MDDPRIGMVLEGRYRVDERIAAGGMGIVYRGERLGLGRAVAVKFLHRSSAFLPGRRERFDREAAAMSRLTHPNLVSIIDYGTADEVPYLVMEFHAGETLSALLGRSRIPLERAVGIARQLLAGLGGAHAADVIHRDLKPANIILVEGVDDDFVKILDFGVAKLLDTGAGPSELSAVAGRALGTPQYMAPEQARVEATDARTDLYAVGIILYQMVTGRRPFEAEVDLVVLQMQVQDEPAPPRQLEPLISPELEEVILEALEKDPDRRFRSAAEFAAALAAVPEATSRPTPRARAAVEPDPVAAVPAAPEPATPAMTIASSRRPWRKLRLVLGLLLLLELIAAGTWLVIDRGLVLWSLPSWVPWSGDRETSRPAVAPAPPTTRPEPAAQPPDAAPPPDAALMSMPDESSYLSLPDDAGPGDAAPAPDASAHRAGTEAPAPPAE